jgi:hypothetical protein
MSYDLQEEPWIGLAFENAAAGKSIFEHWRSKFGMSDDGNRIRLSIVTGIDKANPHAYRMVVGSNLPVSENTPKAKQFVSVSRIQRMDAQSSTNVDTFRDRFDRVGFCRLMPAHLSFETGTQTPFFELSIQKKEIRIVAAWQIGEHDLDSMGVLREDNPHHSLRSDRRAGTAIAGKQAASPKCSGLKEDVAYVLVGSWISYQSR